MELQLPPLDELPVPSLAQKHLLAQAQRQPPRPQALRPGSLELALELARRAWARGHSQAA